MSQLLSEAFARYLGRIELNPNRVKVASERYNAIKTVLEAAIPGVGVRQIGSFQRKTKIRPIDLGDGLDLDVIVAIGTATHYARSGEAGITPSAAQDKILRALRTNAIYRVMKPEKDAPTVLLEYSDRDHFAVELVPAFVDQTGDHPRPGGPPCYIIAGANGAWIPADYDYDASVIRGLNQSTAVQGTVVPLIKMAKAFFRAMGLEWCSFHLEVLAGMILPSLLGQWEARGWSWNYWHAFAGFLRQLPLRMGQALSLPGSYSPPVWAGIADMPRAMQYVADRATQAWYLAKLTNESRALNGWREFFSEPFPAGLTG
jgi:hypothetical protein